MAFFQTYHNACEECEVDNRFNLFARLNWRERVRQDAVRTPRLDSSSSCNEKEDELSFYNSSRPLMDAATLTERFDLDS